MRDAWTHEQLSLILRSLRESIEQTELENPDARPVPPLTEEEAGELLHALAETASVRILTQSETFLHGQLLAVFKMAVLAGKLGYPPGRYFVISEADIAARMKR